MLDACTPWPPDLAARWRAEGLWEGLTLWEMVARTAARHPDKTALVAGEIRQTYADLDRISGRLGAAWLALGLKPRDRVVMQLPNVPAFVHHYLALVRIGAIPVMALRAHRLAEVRHFVRASGAVAYVGPDAIKDFDYRALMATARWVPSSPTNACACSRTACSRKDPMSSRTLSMIRARPQAPK